METFDNDNKVGIKSDDGKTHLLNTVYDKVVYTFAPLNPDRVQDCFQRTEVVTVSLEVDNLVRHIFGQDVVKRNSNNGKGHNQNPLLIPATKRSILCVHKIEPLLFRNFFVNRTYSYRHIILLRIHIGIVIGTCIWLFLHVWYVIAN